MVEGAGQQLAMRVIGAGADSGASAKASEHEGPRHDLGSTRRLPCRFSW